MCFLIFIMIFFLTNCKNRLNFLVPNVEKIMIYKTKNKDNIFNISFVKYNDDIKFLARREIKRGFSNIIAGDVSDLKNISSIKWKDVNFPLKNAIYEDPRIFIINNRIFSIQTVVKLDNSHLLKKFSNHNNLIIFYKSLKISIAELDVNFNVVNFKYFNDFPNTQKNWTLFENNGKSYVITDFLPFTFYQINLDTFEFYDKKMIHHSINYDKKKFRCCRVFDCRNNILKVLCHLTLRNKEYAFQFFEINLENEKIESISKIFSLKNIDDNIENTLSNQNFTKITYPHHINYVDNELILSVSKDDRFSIFYKILEKF